MDFAPSSNSPTQRYRIESAARIRHGGRQMEYHEVAQVELTLLDTGPDAWTCQLRTHSLELHSNNALFQWTRDVNALLDELVLRIGPNGTVQGVLNEAQLLRRWPAHRQYLADTYGGHSGNAGMLAALDQAMHTPGFISQHLAQNGYYDFMFPNLHGSRASAVAATTKVIPGFFGSIDLPLLLEHRAEPTGPGQPVQIHSTGQLDAQRFDANSFRRLLRDATDCYDLETNLLADYETIYHFAQPRWLWSAELFLAVAAGGTAFTYTLGRQLTTLAAFL